MAEQVQIILHFSCNTPNTVKSSWQRGKVQIQWQRHHKTELHMTFKTSFLSESILSASPSSSSSCLSPQHWSELALLIITLDSVVTPCKIHLHALGFLCSKLMWWSRRWLFVPFLSCLVSGNKMKPTPGREGWQQGMHGEFNGSHSGIISGIFHSWIWFGAVICL